MPESAGFRYGIVAFTAIILATLFWHVDDSPKGIMKDRARGWGFRVYLLLHNLRILLDRNLFCDLGLWCHTSSTAMLRSCCCNRILFLASKWFLHCHLPYWIWFHYIYLLIYSYKAMMQNKFHDSCICYTRGVQIFDNTLISQLPSAMKEKQLGTFGGVLGMNLTTETCLATSMIYGRIWG